MALFVFCSTASSCILNISDSEMLASLRRPFCFVWITHYSLEDLNDQNQVVDQRLSLKDGLLGVLSLAGSESLVVVIVI